MPSGELGLEVEVLEMTKLGQARVVVEAEKAEKIGRR